METDHYYAIELNTRVLYRYSTFLPSKIYNKLLYLVNYTFKPKN